MDHVHENASLLPFSCNLVQQVFSVLLCHVILCVITITVMIEMVEVSSSLNLMSLLLCLSDLGPGMLRGGFGRSSRCIKKSIWKSAKPGSRSWVKRHLSRS